MTMPKTFALALLASLMACAAQAGCSLPPAPTKVPDGATATEPEMLAAMQTLKKYNADVNNYVKCLEFEANQSRLSREEQARQHNAAIDKLQSIAAQFNEQVRIFKKKA